MGMVLQLLSEYTGETFMRQLGNLVYYIVSIAGALMILYAVYIGYLFATASDANKRTSAKNRLIKTIASALIVVALSSILTVIKVNFDKVDGRIDENSGGGTLATSNYIYDGLPTLTMTCPTFDLLPGDNEIRYCKMRLTGSFTVDIKCIYRKDADTPANGTAEGERIKLTEYRILEPQKFPKIRNFLGQEIVGQQVGADGKTFQYDTGTMESVRLNAGQNYDLPCKKSNGIKVISIAVGFYFTYDEKKVIQTLIMDVALDFSSCEHVSPYFV